MLKKIAQRLAVGRNSFDPVAYWTARAREPETVAVMWANRAYNALADRDEWSVIERNLPQRRDAVLDLGCGTGRMTERLAKRFTSYTGVDIEAMIDEGARRHPSIARDGARPDAPGARFVVGTVSDYDYPADSFDLVLTIGVLATACTKATLPEVARRMMGSLRSGGRAVLLEGFHESALLTRGCKMTSRGVARVFEGLGANVEIVDGMLFFPARIALSEQVFDRFPRLTALGYEIGERAVRLRPAWLADYGIIVVSKP